MEPKMEALTNDFIAPFRRYARDIKGVSLWDPGRVW